ncbi:MAG: 50S ribosomal protein L23 [bacterium]|nr:50S ribosomal protein L23 [bacterium]
MDSFYQIIRRPLITEKGNILREENKYIFEVGMQANKIEIKKAIEKIYKVKVVKVHTLIQHGKPRRVRYAIGKRPDFKKAIVTLKQGELISAFEA